MNKKGSLMDPIVWIITGFITILFFASWIFAHGLLTEKLITIETTTGEVNISDAAQKTFAQANEGLQTLRILAFVIIFASALSILISNFLIRAHPAFFILHVLIVILAVILAVVISNAYEGLMTNETLGATLTSFSGGSFIMLNLPVFVTAVGLFGALFLFIGILRRRGDVSPI